jgi:hypothetical protein
MLDVCFLPTVRSGVYLLPAKRTNKAVAMLFIRILAFWNIRKKMLQNIPLLVWPYDCLPLCVTTLETVKGFIHNLMSLGP